MNGTTPPNPFAGLAGAFPDMSALNWTQVVKPQAKIAEALLRHNAEMLAFLKARLDRDREFLASVSEVQSPAEAIGLWQGFWQKTVADYAAETDRLAATGAALAEETIRSVTDGGVAAMGAAAKTAKG